MRWFRLCLLVWGGCAASPEDPCQLALAHVHECTGVDLSGAGVTCNPELAAGLVTEPCSALTGEGDAGKADWGFGKSLRVTVRDWNGGGLVTGWPGPELVIDLSVGSGDRAAPVAQQYPDVEGQVRFPRLPLLTTYLLSVGDSETVPSTPRDFLKGCGILRMFDYFGFRWGAGELHATLWVTFRIPGTDIVDDCALVVDSPAP